ERVVDALVDVDALDTTAALAGVEESAVDQILDRMIELRVGADVGGILSAKLQGDRGECARCRPLDGTAARYAACEGHVIHLACTENARCILMPEHQVPEQPSRQSHLIECLLESLSGQDRLRGGLTKDEIGR